MLRYASPFVIAVYATVRLTPQDRERNPEALLAGRRGAKSSEPSSLPGHAAQRHVNRAPCLRPFYEAVPFSRPFKTSYEVVDEGFFSSGASEYVLRAHHYRFQKNGQDKENPENGVKLGGQGIRHIGNLCFEGF